MKRGGGSSRPLHLCPPFHPYFPPFSYHSQPSTLGAFLTVDLGSISSLQLETVVGNFTIDEQERGGRINNNDNIIIRFPIIRFQNQK